LGIGDWGFGPIPNPQSPIPNPQSPIPMKYLNLYLKFKNYLKCIVLFNINYSLLSIIFIIKINVLDKNYRI